MSRTISVDCEVDLEKVLSYASNKELIAELKRRKDNAAEQFDVDQSLRRRIAETLTKGTGTEALQLLAEIERLFQNDKEEARRRRAWMKAVSNRDPVTKRPVSQ